MPAFHFPAPRPVQGVALAVLALASAAAAAADPPARPRGETLFLRVSVAADGRVASATPFDPAAPMADIAKAYAQKLVFTPARRDGRAVPAGTCLTVRLSAEPRPDGTFGVKLKRAVSGPCLVEVGKTEPPKVPRDAGGLVVMGANLRADGTVDVATMKVESVQLRVPSSFVEARYRDAAEKSMRGSRFEADTVDGKPVAEHVSAPFQFGRGPVKRDYAEEHKRDAPPPPVPLPSWNPTSLEPGVELAKLDFTAE